MKIYIVDWKYCIATNNGFKEVNDYEIYQMWERNEPIEIVEVETVD